MFLPSPSDLLVNLNEARGLIHQLLEELPGMFKDTNETTSALGAALQVIFGTIFGMNFGTILRMNFGTFLGTISGTTL